VTDEPVTLRLVDALIGQSHAELAGQVSALVEAQRASTEAHRLAVELSSQEHEQVRERLEELRIEQRQSIQALSEQVAALQERRVVGDELALIRRRGLQLLCTVIGLVIALVSVLLAAFA
jgi:hypothetical protein